LATEGSPKSRLRFTKKRLQKSADCGSGPVRLS